jgi:hypothetical protein
MGPGWSFVARDWHSGRGHNGPVIRDLPSRMTTQCERVLRGAREPEPALLAFREHGP